MKKIKKSKNYIWYILLGVILLLAAIILLPFWGDIWAECPWKDWGIQFISIAMAVLILMYLFGFLVKKITKSSGTIQVLTVIEFTLLALIALGLVFSQFRILNIPDEPSVIIGIALYIRGVIEIFRAYYYKQSSNYTYPVYWLVVAILFVTFGVIFMISVSISKLWVLWVLIISLVVLSIILIVYGALMKPNKPVEKTKDKNEKKDNKKK